MCSQNNTLLSNIHPHLLAAQALVYEPSGLTCTLIDQEVESKEYGACNLKINNLCVKFRVGKITPTKIGQFVTLWKRIGNGPIQPYDMADDVDLFVVSVRNADHFDQFVFPKTVLYQKGVISKDCTGGKRAMRVYPPWDKVDNQQAEKTQHWQLLYFFEIHPSHVDTARIQKLYSIKSL